MRILIIGGTVFLGRALVEAGLESGHDLTLFNRGTHQVEFSGPVEQLQGDRTQDLSVLDGRTFDAVLDTCGFAPSVVARSARALAGAAPVYAFVSSISVYRSDLDPPLTESSPVGELPAGAGEDVTGETYGPLKALCEAAVQAAFPGGAVIVRPGMIVGPRDPTDRFLYWPDRISQGGTVLAPGDPGREVQLIDARDLAAWMIGLVERGQTGVFNATGPEGRLSMGAMLRACGEAELEWVDEAFLLERGVEPWTELPFWMPETGEDRAVFRADIGPALEAGLRFRPLEQTVADLMAWHATRGTRVGPPNMTREREAELLAEWGNGGRRAT